MKTLKIKIETISENVTVYFIKFNTFFGIIITNSQTNHLGRPMNSIQKLSWVIRGFYFKKLKILKKKKGFMEKNVFLGAPTKNYSLKTNLKKTLIAYSTTAVSFSSSI